MRVAFGMCGYPKEGGHKNSTQSKFPESLSLLCDGGSQCVAQTDKAGVAPLAHPVPARLWAELYRLETETGIASDIQPESTDLGSLVNGLTLCASLTSSIN